MAFPPSDSPAPGASGGMSPAWAPVTPAFGAVSAPVAGGAPAPVGAPQRQSVLGGAPAAALCRRGARVLGGLRRRPFVSRVGSP